MSLVPVMSSSLLSSFKNISLLGHWEFGTSHWGRTVNTSLHLFNYKRDLTDYNCINCAYRFPAFSTLHGIKRLWVGNMSNMMKCTKVMCMCCFYSIIVMSSAVIRCINACMNINVRPDKTPLSQSSFFKGM